MAVLATMTEPETRLSTGSSRLDDWETTTSWRRMYLSLSDAGDMQTLRMAAQLSAGLASSYAEHPPATDSAQMSRMSVRGGSLYAALVHAVDALRYAGVAYPDAAVCHLIRKLHAAAPSGFERIGQNNRGHGHNPYIPLCHRPHYDE